MAQQEKCSYDKTLNAYTMADELPQYPDGMVGFLKFFSHNFKYPNTTELPRRIVYCFIVTSKGKLTNIGIYNKTASAYTIFEKEAIRVISLSPNWIPAKCGNKNVAFQMRLPVIIEPPAEY